MNAHHMGGHRRIESVGEGRKLKIPRTKDSNYMGGMEKRYPKGSPRETADSNDPVEIGYRINNVYEIIR